MTVATTFKVLKAMGDDGIVTLRMDCSKVKSIEDSLGKCIFELIKREYRISEKDIRSLMDKNCKEIRIIIGNKESNCSNCRFFKTYNGCRSGVNFKNLNVLATAMA